MFPMAGFEIASWQTYETEMGRLRLAVWEAWSASLSQLWSSLSGSGWRSRTDVEDGGDGRL